MREHSDNSTGRLSATDGPSAFSGTTFREVVRAAEDREDLLARLYRFTLEESVPSGGSRSDLEDAAATLICRLLELSESGDEAASEPARLRETVRALRRLRRPDSEARVHRRAGWRNRVRQWLLRHFGGARRRSLESLPEPTDATPETSDPILCEGDLEAGMRSEISERLARAFVAATRTVTDGLRRRGRPATFLRRSTIAEILAEHARQSTQLGVIADHFEATLDEVRPEDVLVELQRRRVLTSRGRRAVTASTVRKDIAMVKELWREALAELRDAERELRFVALTDWVHELLRDDLSRSEAAQEHRSPPHASEGDHD